MVKSREVSPAIGAAADLTVIAGWSIGAVAFALFVVATGAVMRFAGRRGDPVARLLSRGCTCVRRRGIRGGRG